MDENLNYNILSEEDEIRAPTLCGTKPCISRFYRALSNITVEPLGIIIMFVINMYSLISYQYIYQYIAKENGLNLTDHTSTCGSTTSSLENKVSAESSQWVLYLNVGGFVPTLFSTVILGTWGDSVGRRIPMLFGYYGFLFLIIMYLVVVIFELHMVYLLVGRIICGLMGDLALILCCMFAYLADISSKKNRTFNMAIGEATLGIGGALGSLLNGLWVEKQGFIPPIIFMIAILSAGILYVTFVLPESKPIEQIGVARKVKSLFTWQPYIGLKNTMFGRLSYSLKIWGIVICFFLQYIVINGYYDISSLYELSPPLCFSPSLLGYASAMFIFAAIVSMIMIKILPFNDYLFVFIGVLSHVSIYLFYIYSTEAWMIFVGLVCGLVNTLSIIVIRSVTSKLVSAGDQGSVFAVSATAQAIAGLTASFMFNSIYSATVAWYAGFVFFVLILVEVVLFLLFSYVYLKVRNELTDLSVNVCDNDGHSTASSV